MNQLFRRRYAPVWLTVVVGLAATAALRWQLRREAVALDRQRLAMRVAEVTAQLDARLEKSEMLLLQLRDYPHRGRPALRPVQPKGRGLE